MSGRIVIVGAGVAGATAAQTLRREGYAGEIVLVGDEPDLPYRRPAVSKELLAGTGSFDRALLKPVKFWVDNRIDLRPAFGVEEIDIDRATVRSGTGEVLGYDSLLLATGARARTIDTTSTRVHTLRTRADIAALQAAVTAGGSLLIIGGGLIGCEVAATVRGLGARVTVLDAGAALMDRVVPAAVSDVLRRLHEEHGVVVENGVLTTQVVDAGTGVTATAADGRTWSAAAALVAVGSVPETALAEAAGIAVNDGIVVDQHYRTSAAGVFAAGDATTGFHPLRGEFERGQHWNSAMTAGAAAALSMLGHPAAPAEVPWGWTDQHGVSMQFAGWIHPHDELVVDGDLAGKDFLAVALRDRRPVGAVAMRRPRELRAIRPLIAAGQPWQATAPVPTH
ncbi:pyridine nucleotide-disulfide oxidoreductase [Nocardia sp. MH4]|uniref:NAD(P)/FAD-dependent oxidoreductase n=1 Tax=Nocardia TaxID=1817 RepID=UPI001C4F4C15|nr:MULTISPECIES: FAD-dependent oxidoreductase [Nocardia]MBW0269933.1 pyridine nucleotide-disulfide oxidoreductase [Nocardia sp. MH4]